MLKYAHCYSTVNIVTSEVVVVTDCGETVDGRTLLPVQEINLEACTVNFHRSHNITPNCRTLFNLYFSTCCAFRAFFSGKFGVSNNGINKV